MRSTYPLISFLLAGCAALPRPGETPTPEPVALDGPSEVLWEALPMVYDSLGFDGAVADSAQKNLWVVRVVSLWTPWIGPVSAPHVRCTVENFVAPIVAGARRRLNPAHIPVRIPPAQVTLTVSTNLSQVDTLTRVESRVSAVPTRSGTGSGSTYCVSTGRLEARIVELLQARLAG
jgi:hypothetical protein